MQIPKTIQNKLDEGRQYRLIDAAQLVTRADEVGGMFVEGYASTFDDPYLLYRDGQYEVWEQIDKNAFAECDLNDCILQYDHRGRVFARTSNGTLAVDADDIGLHIRAELGGTEIGRQLYEEIRGGYTTKMSFGFKVAEDKQEVTENNEDGSIKVLRTITKIGKLYDVSAVSIPANDATSISARTYGEGVIAEVQQELLKREEHERKKQQIKVLLEL